MTSTKPAIVLVPGSFAKVSLYASFTAKLHAAGFPRVEVVRMPSLGNRAPLPPATVADDADYIRQIVTEVANEGWDVLLMSHSYGGVPATESVRGVSKKERSERGEKGGVVRLLYTTAVVPELGGGLPDVMGSNVPSSIQMDEAGYMWQSDLPFLASITLNTVSPEEGLSQVQLFGRHSAASFGSKLAYEGFQDVPVSYMFCEEDKCVTPENQQWSIDMMERKTGRKVAVYKYPADHIPYYSSPDSVLDAIERAIKEGE